MMPPPNHSYETSSRTLILVFGIISLVLCAPLGIAA